MSYKAQTSVGLVSTFDHTSWSWYWVLLKTFSYCWYWVGPRLIFGWHEAGISLVLTCKRPIGTRLVLPQVPTRWYWYQDGISSCCTSLVGSSLRVLALDTIVDTRCWPICQTNTDVNHERLPDELQTWLSTEDLQ
jgi:hypothetical protein